MALYIVSMTIFYEFIERLFGAKCVRCDSTFKDSDLVMRSSAGIFHFDCFRCVTCSKRLLPGDEYSSSKNGNVFCKSDFIESSSAATEDTFSFGHRQSHSTTAGNTDNALNNNSNNNNTIDDNKGLWSYDHHETIYLHLYIHIL